LGTDLAQRRREVGRRRDLQAGTGKRGGLAIGEGVHGLPGCHQKCPRRT
jgi:hypothetical protein